jgi:hypothetical protein
MMGMAEIKVIDPRAYCTISKLLVFTNLIFFLTEMAENLSFDLRRIKKVVQYSNPDGKLALGSG